MWIADTGKGVFEGEALSTLAKQVGEHYYNSRVPNIKSLTHLNSHSIETCASHDGVIEFQNEAEEWAEHTAEMVAEEEEYRNERRRDGQC